jgi:hypothetical protein
MQQEKLLEKTGLLFYNSGQYRQAALLMGEAILINPEHSSIWCALGSSFAELSMGRKSYLEISTRILKRCLAIEGGGEYHRVAEERLRKIISQNPSYNLHSAIQVEEIEELITTIALSPEMFLNATKNIKDDDRILVIMSIGGLKRGH